MKALSVHKLEKLDVIGRNIMTGNMIGFVIWAMVGVIIISLGIRAYLSGKVADFWANIKSISVNDIMGYNHAVGKLFVIYGAILIAFGLPLLSGQNSPFILLSVLGVMIETIVIMVVYSLCKESIENNSFCSFNFILYNLLLFKNKNAKIKVVKILSKIV